MNLALLTEEERIRYNRSIILPEVGEHGQRQLKSASVLLVGTGGLGSSVAMHLAAAGVGRIGIVDPDKVEKSNLQRQIIHDTDMTGRLKVESAKNRMLNINPHIQVDTCAERLTAQNGNTIAADYQILIDGTDNFTTRYLINDLCARNGKTYVYGALYHYEGQVSVFNARKGPCYRCLFPQPPSEEPPQAYQYNPAEKGVFSTVPGIIGTIQASEVLKLILGIGSPLLGRLLFVNTLHMNFQEIELAKDPDCAICGAARC